MPRTNLAFSLFLILASGCGGEDNSSSGSGGVAGAGVGGSGGAAGSTGGSGGGAGTGGGAGLGGDSGVGGAAGASGGAGVGGGAGTACGKPKPGPSNTGVPAGVQLKASGSIQVTQDGAIVEGLDIAGAVTVLADNVTIRNCRITSGDYYPIRYFDNNNVGLVVEDTEIASKTGATAGISFANYTARRLNVHGSADGFKADSNVLIEDCWVHDLSNAPGEHNDAVQSTGGKGVTIRHNTLEDASNAAVQTGDLGGATEDLTIECNWLYGGGYTLNIRGKGSTVPKNTKVIDNRFGNDSAYGPWVIDDPNPTVTGNVWDATGQAIPYP